MAGKKREAAADTPPARGTRPSAKVAAFKAAAEKPKARALAPERKSGASPRAGKVGAVKAFHDAFTADLPAEAAAGSYATTVRDRFHGRRYDIPDGAHAHGEWRFVFAGGAFVQADRLPVKVGS